MDGYKVFNSDWTCRDMHYEVGKTYEMDDNIEPCCRGFHFCRQLSACFNYYAFSPMNKVAKVRAYGKLMTDDNVKYCTNKIEIVGELTWEEVLRLCNTGSGNSGNCNSGNSNSGNSNSGDWNSGNRNSGNCNSGDWNSGNSNSGNCNSGNSNSGNSNSGDWNSGNSNSGNSNSGNSNSGNSNSGDWNSGNRNSGNCNSGNWNSGDRNSGDWNSGNRNSGNCNSGDRNSGDWNSGNSNSGNSNSGDWNSGNRNSGDCNSGNWNKAMYSFGMFNTTSTPAYMFNKPTELTLKAILNARYTRILNMIPIRFLDWVYSDDMTEAEQQQHPEYKVTGGYLKAIEPTQTPQQWYDNLSDDDKSCILSMPNFNAEIFKDITGIDVEKTERSE